MVQNQSGSLIDNDDPRALPPCSNLEIKVREWQHSAANNDARQKSEDWQLSDRTVHVWHRSLLADPLEVEEMRELLSADERERAARFHFAKHAAEFILTRATLRRLIGLYARISPKAVSFTYASSGKPSCKAGGMHLRFNVSHTDGVAALAFVKEREVGIDVEKIRPDIEARTLAERFFSAKERAALQPLSGDELSEGFFRCWTRKEAYIKAKGGGLSIPLHEFDVSVDRDSPAALVGTRPDPAEAGHWTMSALSLRAGYAAAVVVEKFPDRL